MLNIYFFLAGISKAVAVPPPITPTTIDKPTRKPEGSGTVFEKPSLILWRLFRF